MRRPPTQGRAKQSYSHEPSPISRSYIKADLSSNIFQMPDLNPNPKDVKVTALLSGGSSIHNNQENSKIQMTNILNSKQNAQFNSQSNNRVISSFDGSKPRGQSASRPFKKPPHRSNYEQVSNDDVREPSARNSVPASVQIARKKIQRESYDPSPQKINSTKVSNDDRNAEMVSLIQIQRPVSILPKENGNPNQKSRSFFD